MEFDEINPWAVMFGILGAGITIFMMRFGGGSLGIKLLWRILTPIATFAACFFLTQKMFDN